VIDLVPDGPGRARERAQALLREHASCEAVEVWRGGLMVEKVLRT
jgi:hypothetical protein